MIFIYLDSTTGSGANTEFNYIGAEITAINAARNQITFDVFLDGPDGTIADDVPFTYAPSDPINDQLIIEGSGHTPGERGEVTLNDGDHLVSTVGRVDDILIQGGGALFIADNAHATITKTRGEGFQAVNWSGQVNLGNGALLEMRFGNSISFRDDSRIVGSATETPTLKYVWAGANPGGAGPRFRFDNPPPFDDPIPNANNGRYNLEIEGNRLYPVQMLFNGRVGVDKLPQGSLTLTNTRIISHNGLNSLGQRYDFNDLDLSGNSGLVATSIDIAPHSVGVTGTDGAASNAPFMHITNAVGRTESGNEVYPKFGFNLAGANRSGIGVYYQEFTFSPDNSTIPVSLRCPSTGITTFSDSSNNVQTVPTSFTHDSNSGTYRLLGENISFDDQTTDQSTTQPVRTFYFPQDLGAANNSATDIYIPRFQVDSFGTTAANQETVTIDRYIYGSLASRIGIAQFDVMSLGSNIINIPNVADTRITAAAMTADITQIGTITSTSLGIAVDLNPGVTYNPAQLIRAIKEHRWGRISGLSNTQIDGITIAGDGGVDSWPTGEYQDWLINVNPETGVFRMDDLSFNGLAYEIEADNDFDTIILDENIEAQLYYSDAAGFTKWDTVQANNITRLGGNFMEGEDAWSDTNWTGEIAIGVINSLENMTLNSPDIDFQGNNSITQGASELTLTRINIPIVANSNEMIFRVETTLVDCDFGTGTPNIADSPTPAVTVNVDANTRRNSPMLVAALEAANYDVIQLSEAVTRTLTVNVPSRILVQRIRPAGENCSSRRLPC